VIFCALLVYIAVDWRLPECCEPVIHDRFAVVDPRTGGLVVIGDCGLGIEATAGFGVKYQGLHGTDERIRIDSIPTVQAAYHQACLVLLTSS